MSGVCVYGEAGVPGWWGFEGGEGGHRVLVVLALPKPPAASAPALPPSAQY